MKCSACEDTAQRDLQGPGKSEHDMAFAFGSWVCDPVKFGSDSCETAVVMGKDIDEALKTVTAGEPETSHHT